MDVHTVSPTNTAHFAELKNGPRKVPREGTGTKEKEKPIEEASLTKPKPISEEVMEKIAENQKLEINHDEIQRMASDLIRITSTLDKRLKFEVSDDLNQVVVKVIDTRTDKVIKEYPPEEIQELHSKIKEALGVLVDELI